MENSVLSQIKEVCFKALDGKLKLNEFYDSWPQNLNDNKFLEVVYSDVEEGVEHAPGLLLSSKVDINKWKKSQQYNLILIDVVLLSFNFSAEKSLKIRAALKKSNLNFINDSDVRKKIKEFNIGF